MEKSETIDSVTTRFVKHFTLSNYGRYGGQKGALDVVATIIQRMVDGRLNVNYTKLNSAFTCKYNNTLV
uniref:Uncharacterized protein n=1 Tax=Romanomermis culicivorax TaxID=13658 RepID=A0A915JCQ1_ROMCU